MARTSPISSRTHSHSLGRRLVVLIAAAACLLIAGGAGAQQTTTDCVISERGTPLARMIVANPWTGRIVGRTDTQGCVTLPGGSQWVLIWAQNPVVRMQDNEHSWVYAYALLDGGSPNPVPDFFGQFEAAEWMRQAYDDGLRYLAPWNGREFPHSSAPGSSNVIEAMRPDFYLQPLPFVEPVSPVSAAGMPRIHLKEPFSLDPTNPNHLYNHQEIAAHELAHALHFAQLPLGVRLEVEARYGEFLGTSIGNFRSPTHGFERVTNPFIAFIEAFGLFGGFYANVPGQGVEKERAFYALARNAFEGTKEAELLYPSTDFSRSAVTGADVEGAVMFTLYVEFASHPAVGLDYVVSTVVSCESLDIFEYADCIAEREGADSQIAFALRAAGALFGIDLPGPERAWASTNDQGDGFGEAAARGDFDGDGDLDLAIGAPGDRSTESGSVFVFRNTPDGLVPWMRLEQSQLGGSEEVGDRFGAALAAGDFDGDGVDDLAVGAPGEALGPIPAGIVWIYRGTEDALFSLQPGGQIEQGSLPGPYGDDAGDAFGASLLATRLLPGGPEHLLVGAPGDGAEGAGSVYVLDFGTGGVQVLQRLESEGDWNQRDVGMVYEDAHSGDEFGAALATSGTGADLRLVIGAPGRPGATTWVRSRLTSEDAGAAFVYAWDPIALRFTRRDRLDIADSGRTPTAGDRFGHAIVAGASSDSREHFMIAAPGATSRTGAYGLATAWGLVFRYAEGYQRFSVTHTIALDGERGGRMTLASVGNRIAVGIEDGRVGSAASGVVRIYRKVPGSFELERTLTQNGLGGNETGDRFGAAVIDLGDVLVVTAPGESPASDPRSGYAFAFERNGSQLDAWHELGQRCLNPGTARCPADLDYELPDS
jgi:hypothetical protein